MESFALETFEPERPFLAAAIDLMHRIQKAFTFYATATSVATPVTEVLAMRRGVCQDFAHLQIAAIRLLPSSAGGMLAAASQFGPLPCFLAVLAAELAELSVLRHHALTAWVGTLAGVSHNVILTAPLYARDPVSDTGSLTSSLDRTGTKARA